MILKDVLSKSAMYLKNAGFETARLDCELLFSHALSLTRMDLYLKFDYPLSEFEKEKCRILLKRRATGEPVSYILGEKEFFGYKFFVNSHVLIPRPETELMIERFLEIEKDFNKKLKVFDFGSGSGCIGLSVLKKFPQALLKGFDISKKAILVSEKNAENLQVKIRSEFINQSVGELLSDKAIDKLKSENFEKVDVIFANPPYIDEEDENVCPNVRKYEPRIALFAKNKGLDLIFDWVQVSEKYLKPGGYLFLEMGADQKDKVEKFLRDSFKNFNYKFHKDYQGYYRFVECELTKDS